MIQAAATPNTMIFMPLIIKRCWRNVNMKKMMARSLTKLKSDSARLINTIIDTIHHITTIGMNGQPHTSLSQSMSTRAMMMFTKSQCTTRTLITTDMVLVSIMKTMRILTTTLILKTQMIAMPRLRIQRPSGKNT